ncbi:ribose-5-phosphate isomerase B, partial [gut metagenome]
MRIGIGNDHVAIGMKNIIKEHLESLGHEVVDFGTDSPERFDYPIAGYGSQGRGIGRRRPRRP